MPAPKFFTKSTLLTLCFKCTVPDRMKEKEMTVIIRFKGEDVEVIRGVKKIEDISGWIEIDNQKYMKSDIRNIEIIWR